MKIAITSQGKELSSEIDLRFGRAKFLLVVDTETDDFQVHDNELNLNAVQGAGIQTGQNIANLGVEAVITGNVGPNAFKTLNAAGVKIFLAEKQTVAEAIDSFKAGELKEVDQANVEGHWVQSFGFYLGNKIMRIFLDCIPCFVRQALDSARLATDDEQIHEKVVREVLRLAADLDMSQSPPVIGQQIHRLIRKLIDNDDPYRGIKKQFNNLALKLYSGLRKQIVSSDDRLETAVRLAIAGNIIDFGVKTSLTESDLKETIAQSLNGHFNNNQIQEFKDAVMTAEKILYLADNAGEVVFDRLLIEQLPYEKITVVVKGTPVINDATMEDANLAGLTRVVEVIDNGSDGPGTILETCSQAFRGRFEDADLIIAKGQGNYETLSNADKNIFFILKAKCPVIARDLGCKVGEMILQKSNSFKSVDNLIKEAE